MIVNQQHANGRFSHGVLLMDTVTISLHEAIVRSARVSA
jgi:hypothetical protein